LATNNTLLRHLSLYKKDATKRLFLCPWIARNVAKSLGRRGDEYRGTGRIPQGDRRAMWLWLLLSIAYFPQVLAQASCASENYDEFSIIRYIHDGDTLHLKDGRKVRLIGINAPELARDGQAEEAFANEAKNALKALFNKDKSITLLHGKDKKDRYGRLLAHVFSSDGQNVQAILLKQGYALAIVLPPNTRFASCYLEMENIARCDNKGLWKNTDILEAKNLNNHEGFHLIKGKIENIENNSKGFWLNLDGKLTVGIRPDNLPLFDLKVLNSMLNQTVVVRGWLNKSNRSTPYYLRVRHPLSLQLFSSLSCE